MAKPCQIDQFLDIVEEFGLEIGEWWIGATTSTSSGRSAMSAGSPTCLISRHVRPLAIHPKRLWLRLV